MSKAIKAGFGYVIGNYLLKGLVFLTIPIFSRLLSPSDYGIYNTFVAYESMGTILLSLAIHSSYKNAKYKYAIKTNGTTLFDHYVSTTMIFLIISALVWVLAIFFLSNPLSNILGLDEICLFFLVPYCLGCAIITCFNSYMGLQYKFKNYLIVASINALTSVVLSIILIKTMYSSQPYMGRIIGTTLPIAVIGVIIVVYFIKQASPQKYADFLGWGVKYSFPIVPHGLSQIVLSQFDRVMIFKMIGMAEAGIYSFCYNIYTIFFVTINSLDSVWGPWFYEKMYENNLDQIKQKSTMYIILMSLFASLLTLVSPELVIILAPNTYYEAIYCVIPVVGAGFFVFLYNIPASVEYFHEKTKYIAAGTMSAAVINILLNLYFIPTFGYVAAAYTTFATYIIYFIFHYVLAWRIEKRCLFDTKKIIFISLGVVLIVFGARALVHVFIARWVMAVILGIISIYFEESKFGFIKKKIRRIKNG